MSIWHQLARIEQIKESANLMGCNDIIDQCDRAREHYRNMGYIRDFEQIENKFKAAMDDFMVAPVFGSRA